MSKKKKDNTNIEHIVSEIQSLHANLDEFRKGIEKIENYPKEKDAEAVGYHHENLVLDLKQIADKIEKLPEKWEKENTKDN
ncbi:MAG: hypothetical protein KAR24_00360 [Candidatus Pacebacteria bacterium]|nr:hypothetical protein [Candidatus Paceibacterota bacterium]